MLLTLRDDLPFNLAGAARAKPAQVVIFQQLQAGDHRLKTGQVDLAVAAGAIVQAVDHFRFAKNNAGRHPFHLARAGGGGHAVNGHFRFRLGEG